jgi:exosortase D (VPLPA-CTERM-specific)
MSIQPVERANINISSGFLALAAGLVTFAAFGGALLNLVKRWSTEDAYSHGFLIPLIVVWLLWNRREALFASVGPPAWSGPILVLLAIVMLVVGELSATFILSQLGFILALMGIALGFGGITLLRVTLIPILFLIFAIPLPYFVDAALSLQLQLISSELGVLFIKLFQIPVFLDGNIIDLGSYQLQVVDACSGLRYLFPLLSLSFLAAYLFRAPAWQRAVVIFSGIPITITMNGFRIGMVGLTVDRWGIKTAEGLLHFFEGWIIFIACAALLAAEIYLFSRISGEKFSEALCVPTGTVREPRGPAHASSRIALIACLLLLCAAGMASAFVSDRREPYPERNRFVMFPARIESWLGHTSILDPEIEHGLGFDDYILSDYTQSDGKPVNLYVAYYASQRKGESPHSPLVCVPGDGWLITNLKRTSYDISGTEQILNRVIIERNGVKQIVYYWYDERGRKIASEYLAKWYLFSDAITTNRSDGALVRLMTTVFPGEREGDGDERLRSFMRVLLPRLSSYLPAAAVPEVISLRNAPEHSQE